MNEMLSRFVNEALSCLIIVPTTVLCLLPMKDKMKYSIKNVLPLFLGVLVMVTVIVSGATALLPVDPKVVFYILLVPLFLAYRVIVDADIVKCFATFLLSFAIMSFCKNYAIMIDAVIHPELGVPTFSTDGALIQLGISCAVTHRCFCSVTALAHRWLNMLFATAIARFTAELYLRAVRIYMIRKRFCRT